MQKRKRITLASSSPRRKALLEDIGLKFDIYPADINEDIRQGESPLEHTLRLAEEKAKAAAKKIYPHTKDFGVGVKNGWIIGADTIVFIDNRILGKPSDINEARDMLNLLSGRCHKVVTAFCLLNTSTDEILKKAVESSVQIKELSNKEIEDYLKTGESLDKAGAYAVQGIGSFMIEKIEGSYTNVIGLPMEELKNALKETGITSF